ncbi:MAG: T9SS type A sorting domain-containing protein [Bacteroidales bacterium]|nr:T9SS type A sorting domain-containing protein [Bacteroidales bacterium]
MKIVSFAIVFLLFSFCVFSQDVNDLKIKKIDAKLRHETPVKNTAAIVQVLDSAIGYSYSTHWDESTKSVTTIRHWEDGSPYEIIYYDYNAGTSSWDNRDKVHINWHDSVYYAQETCFPWNSNLLTWNPDTMAAYNYVYYESWQFWFLYSDVTFSKSYDYNTNQYTSGNRYRPVLLHDTLYEYFYADNYNVSTFQWDNSEKQSYTYDANGMLQTHLDQNWNSSTSLYENDNYSSYVFSGRNLLQSTDQTWVPNQWINDDKDTYTYDGNNKRLSHTDFVWNNGTTTWDSNYRYLYTYSGNLLEEEITQSWNGSSWDNDYRNVYTHDVNGNVITSRNDDWSGGAWVYYRKYTYTYDANNNRLTSMRQYWNVGTTSWDNDYRETNTYNINNDVTYYLREEWDAGTTSWVNYSKQDYTYDANLNNTMYIYARWNISGSAWDYQTKYLYYWSQYDANSVQEMFASPFNAYPNPSNGFVKLDLMGSEFQNITITDAQGKIIMNEPIEGQSRDINLGFYGKGLYIITLSNDYGEHSDRKILVQ